MRLCVSLRACVRLCVPYVLLCAVVCLSVPVCAIACLCVLFVPLSAYAFLSVPLLSNFRFQAGFAFGATLVLVSSCRCQAGVVPNFAFLIGLFNCRSRGGVEL
jgi:hypothetical protein